MPHPHPSLPAALALVALGGAAGSVLRYITTLVSGSISTRFPFGTLIVNIGGCLLMGVLLSFMVQRDQPSAHLRLLLATGFLGGLTTFSAFGADTVQLLQRSQFTLALVNIAANVGLSLGAALVGFTGARAFA